MPKFDIKPSFKKSFFMAISLKCQTTREPQKNRERKNCKRDFFFRKTTSFKSAQAKKEHRRRRIIVIMTVMTWHHEDEALVVDEGLL